MWRAGSRALCSVAFTADTTILPYLIVVTDAPIDTSRLQRPRHKHALLGVFTANRKHYEHTVFCGTTHTYAARTSRMLSPPSPCLGGTIIISPAPRSSPVGRLASPSQLDPLRFAVPIPRTAFLAVNLISRFTKPTVADLLEKGVAQDELFFLVLDH